MKRASRALSSAVERVERELARLLARKTLIENKSLTTLVKNWDGARSAQQMVEAAMVDAIARTQQ